MGDQGATANPAPTNPLVLRVSDDKMQLLLTHVAPLPETPLLLDAVEASLTALQFTRPVARAEWESRVIQAAALQDLHDVPIIEGTPPVPPVHGRIEWVADFFSKGFVADEASGRIDYRQRAAQQSVEKGQLLGHIVPPEEGHEGTDVFGRKVAVEKARPAKLRAGPNVRIDETGGTVHAEATGHIRFKDGLVSVDQVFTVEGSVGLETGNIRHPGTLVVRGDIEADATVETAGQIEVMGLVEAATIIAGGDLIVHGGITGGEGKRIVAVNLRAKFILDADIECGGDVIVETEILQSRITARGAVSCIRGRIVGGRIAAQGGIEAAQLGSEAGVRTVLTAGEDISVASRLAACDEMLADWKRQHDHIATRIAPLKAHVERLDAHAREALARIEEQVGQIEAEMSSVQDEKRRLREESVARTRPQVFVCQRAHTECFFALAYEHMRLTEPIQGPVCFENAEGAIHIRVVQGIQRDSNLIGPAGDRNTHAVASR